MLKIGHAYQVLKCEFGMCLCIFLLLLADQCKHHLKPFATQVTFDTN